MNKFFTKVASLCVGLALAAGVGVAVSSVKAEKVKADSATFEASAMGLANAAATGDTAYSFGSDSNITISFTSGGTATAYYTTGGVRIYNGGTFTISAASGYSMTQIVLTYTLNGAATISCGSSGWVESTQTWSGSGSSSVTWTAGTAKHVRLSGASVTYTSGGGGEEDPVLQSIAISDEKTAYNVGDEFVKPTVTATYDKGEPQDVSASATCTGYNMGVAGNYTVTVSYGGKSTTYDITVTDPSVGEVLYSATFTEVDTHSYTQNKEFTLNGKDWVASVSQVNGGVFYLGCNSTHTAKGILNDNSSFSDVVTALSGVDTAYASAVTTAHAYAMRFSNTYDNVGSVEFVWAGGNNAFQVYLFGDQGDGLVKLASTNYATSGTTVSGSVKWTASEYGESFDEFVIVARPGATGSTATQKTLRAATFKIYEGEEEPVDPSLGTLYVGQVQTGSITMNSSFTVGYSKTADIYEFRAFSVEDPALASDSIKAINWEVGDSTVVSVDVTDGAAKITTLKPGTTTLKAVHSASEKAYNDATVTLEVSKGWVESISVSGLMTNTEYTTQDKEWDPSGLVVTASYHFGWEEVVTSGIEWSFDPSAPAAGITSVVATATLEEVSASSSAQTVSVVEAHAGTAADPFTVAEGIAKAISIGNKSGGEGPWVTTGVISQIVQVLTTGYQNARFYITVDGKTTSPSIYAYDCKYLGNAGFTEETAEEIVVGATVTITGNLLNYNNNTPEYARGCYLLAIQAPETGDIDVTFAPESTSFEIGATGTFTASCETSGVTFSWAVDDSSVLSVTSGGVYEAVGLGVARVTVTATLNDKQGIAFVDFTVNGNYYMNVDSAIDIAAGVESGKTTDYYIYVEGFVKEFATSSKDGKPRAFDISNKGENKSIMVYTNTDPYDDFVNGLSLGDCVRVKAQVQNYSGKYELVNPTREYIEKTSISFAYELLSQTDAVCKDYDGVTDNTDDIEAFWGNLNTLFTGLNDAQKADLVDPTSRGCGETVLNAVARYDYLVAKYGLDNFIAGRNPNLTGVHQIADTTIESDSAMIVVVIAAVTSLTSIAVLLVIKRRKALIK